jgi:hypothetical protein
LIYEIPQMEHLKQTNFLDTIAHCHSIRFKVTGVRLFELLTLPLIVSSNTGVTGKFYSLRQNKPIKIYLNDFTHLASCGERNFDELLVFYLLAPNCKQSMCLHFTVYIMVG